LSLFVSTIHEVRRSIIAPDHRLRGLTLSRGPRTVTIGPLLQRRETRLTDGFPVTRFMLFEQAVAQLLKRERIKRKTIEHRRLQHSKAAA
jgi:hypothetical protein